MPYTTQYIKSKWPQPGEFKYEIRTNVHEIHYPHSHDFYELSLLALGSQTYLLGENSVFHPEGTMVFTREGESHSKLFDGPVRLLQVAFPVETLDNLQQYLGEGFELDALLHSIQSPYITLHQSEVDEVEKSFEELFGILDQKKANAKLRILVMTLMAKFLSDEPVKVAGEYRWLADAMREMEKKQNFVEGLPALVRLTGRTHEHICRSMSRVFGTTPSNFVNSLRLSYAENLLAHTEIDVLSIAVDSGFNTLSYFYSVFKKRYSISPQKYRKNWRIRSQFVDRPTL